jgi:hypothetical protein
MTRADTPDGNLPAGGAGADVTHINVVLNWFEEPKRRMATE